MGGSQAEYGARAARGRGAGAYPARTARGGDGHHLLGHPLKVSRSQIESLMVPVFGEGVGACFEVGNVPGVRVRGVVGW